MVKLAPKKRDLPDLIAKAQKSAEMYPVDDKYRPALFYYFLIRSGGTVHEATSVEGAAAAKRKETKGQGSVRPSAPAAIQSLHSAGFFKEGRTIQETSKRLAHDGYHFGYEATKKALQRADFLIGEGEKRERRYYQRYPPK